MTCIDKSKVFDEVDFGIANKDIAKFKDTDNDKGKRIWGCIKEDVNTMTEQPLRIRCPKCNHLREGFSQVGNNLFISPECMYVTFECLNCQHKFQVEFEASGKIYNAG